MIKLLLPSFLLALSLLVFSPLAVSAQTVVNTGDSSSSSDCSTDSSTSGALTNPLNACNLEDLLHEILQYVVEIGGIFLTLMIIYTGFKFVVARGNEEKITEARTSLLWTIVGGLLLLGAAAIAQAISDTVSSL